MKNINTMTLEEIENRLNEIEPDVVLNHRRQDLQAKDFDVAPILEKSRLTKRANELRAKARTQALRDDLNQKLDAENKRRADFKKLQKRFGGGL